MTTNWILVGAILMSSFQAPHQQYGHIVIGQRPAISFHLRQGDTLPELRNEQVPSRVREATVRAATVGHYDATCSRFFDAQTEFVVLLRAGCKKGEEIEDGEGLAAFTRSGVSVAGTIPTLTARLYLDLQPRVRLREAN